MHDIQNPSNIVDRRVVESSEMLGKECVTCLRILAYSFFKRDSSYRDGRRDRCTDCESAPRLSTEEHTIRMKEMNFSSEAVKKQRWGKDQVDWMVPDWVRIGRPKHHSELIYGIRQLLSTEKLFIRDGNFLNDLAAYRISGVPRPDFDGPRNDYKYIMYIPTGELPEFSLMEFDERAVPVREYQRGWRNVLVRLIKAKLLTEEDVNYQFGRPAENIASQPYRRELQNIRNMQHNSL